MDNDEEKLAVCPECGAEPGKPHERKCEVERCSVCGGQKRFCDCEGHDPAFARWTGYWPGMAEAAFLEMDICEFYASGLHKVLFIKPQGKS